MIILFPSKNRYALRVCELRLCEKIVNKTEQRNGNFEIDSFQDELVRSAICLFLPKMRSRSSFIGLSFCCKIHFVSTAFGQIY